MRHKEKYLLLSHLDKSSGWAVYPRNWKHSRHLLVRALDIRYPSFLDFVLTYS